MSTATWGSPRDRKAIMKRPASASNSMASNIETMIQAAHNHILSDQGAKSPFPSPRSSAAALVTGSVSLQEHMDSFPLVPLSIIPQLSFADLCKCQTALEDLLATLSSDSTDDVQLGKYVARQLSLVKRHLELARARERVLQLVNGELPVSSVAAQVSVGSKPALPIFLQPPSNEHPPPPVCGTYPSFSSATSQGAAQKTILRSSPVNTKSATTKKADAIQMAKAMIKSSKSVTSFVISSSGQGGSSSHKQRRRKLPRCNKQSEEQSRAQLLERERERRKDAAYQRLLARQELQAKKKSEQQQKKVQKQAEKMGEASVMQEPMLLGVTQPTTHQLPDYSSSDESDASEVSNCSESDEANETAIMALEIKTKAPEDDDEQACDVDHQDEDEGDHEETDQASYGDTAESDQDEILEAVDPTQCSNQSTSSNWSKSDEYDDVRILNDRDACGSPQERPEISETTASDWKPTATNDDSGTLDSSDDTQITEVAATSTISQDQDEEIARELQRFIFSRTQMMLERLEQQKRERKANAYIVGIDTEIGKAPLVSVSNNNSVPGDEHVLIAPSNRNIDQDTRVTHDMDLVPSQELAAIQSDENAHNMSGAVDTVSTSITKTPATIPYPKERSILRKQKSTRSIPRAPAKDCVDYRSYFSHFECILTSVFEQRAASEASNNTSSHLREPNATSGTSLRLQLKLYQSWQSIMHDYATVFGNSIATPTSMMPASSPFTAHYRINSTTRSEVCDIVVTALDKLGNWEEHPSGLGLKTTWNLLWTWSKPRVERKTLLAWQKVNHFQYAKALTRKDCLKKNIGKYLAMGGRMKQAYEMIPATFVLPQEYLAFVQAYQDRKTQLDDSQKNIWIMKPVALSRGRGISLVNNLNDVVYSDPVVIQEYIADPLLLDGYKFDLRLYILVTSFNPLEAFLYEEGFVRMCTRTYDTSDLSNLFVHLTNSSIQKDNQEAIGTSENPISAAAQEEAGGTKMTLAYLWKRLEAMGADVEQVKNDIISVILKSLMCGEDHIPFQVNSFDLLGYDILLDSSFRPWLIEINSSPSMARENDLDYQVKDALMLDTIRLVNPLQFDRLALIDVLTRRFHEADEERKRPHACVRYPKDAEEHAARQLNEDLTSILHGNLPRPFGEIPEHLGNYRRICPRTTLYNQLVKLKNSCVRR